MKQHRWRRILLSAMMLSLSGLAFGGSSAIKISLDSDLYSTASLDELYHRIRELNQDDTLLVAMRCLLSSNDYLGGRNQIDLTHQDLCDLVVDEMEARGLQAIVPSTSQRSRDETGLLMVIEPLPRR